MATRTDVAGRRWNGSRAVYSEEAQSAGDHTADRLATRRGAMCSEFDSTSRAHTHSHVEHSAIVQFTAARIPHSERHSAVRRSTILALSLSIYIRPNPVCCERVWQWVWQSETEFAEDLSIVATSLPAVEPA